jgi:hypothetical protein
VCAREKGLDISYTLRHNHDWSPVAAAYSFNPFQGLTRFEAQLHALPSLLRVSRSFNPFQGLTRLEAVSAACRRPV